MLIKLVILHVVVITISNALVNIPVQIAGVKLTWAAFTFPLVVIATDLTVRLLGKNIARKPLLSHIRSRSLDPSLSSWQKVHLNRLP